MNRSFLALGIAAVLLGGCGKEGSGPGVSAKDEQSATTESKTANTREKSIGVQDTAKANITLPAISLLAEAVTTLPTKCDLDKPRCATRNTVIRQVKAAMKPCLGWPGDLDSQTNVRYAKDQAVAVETANLLLVELTPLVTRSTLKNPDEVKTRVQQAMQDWLENGKLAAILAQAKQDAAGTAGLELNYSGKSQSAVEFTLGARLYGCGATGWKVTKNGIHWFGEGVAMGQKFEVALESTLSTGMTRKADTSYSRGVTNNTGETAEVNLK